MLEIIAIRFFVVVVASFISSICGKILFDLLAFGGLLDSIKKRIAKRVDSVGTPDVLKNIADKKLSDAQDIFRQHVDYLCNRSKLLTLIDCPVCLSFWVSVLVSIPLSYFFGLGILLTPILTYYLSQKL